MATYKEVHGTNIQVLSSDPSVTTNGQIWYNSTSGTLKGFANKVNGSWVSGGSMNTARTSLGSANAGTQTAALGFGANTYGNPGITESYNGSTWTETGDLNNKREAFLKMIVLKFIDLYNNSKGIVPATVISSAPLSIELEKEIIKKADQLTPFKIKLKKIRGCFTQPLIFHLKLFLLSFVL